MAVYTPVSFEEMSRFLKEYELSNLVSLTPIVSGVQNSNYLIQTEKEKFILTLYEELIDKENLPYFLELMTHLEVKGISCPLPVKGKDGKALRTLCGKQACLTTFLQGASVFELSPIHCNELGKMLAKMHIAGMDFPASRQNELSVEGWQTLFDKMGQKVNEITPTLFDEISLALTDVTTHFPTNLPQGIIHADLFPDNVFFQEEKLSGLIDFYFACNDFLAYDVAVCLNAWCFDEKTWAYDEKRAQALFAGYQEIRALSEIEKEAFPVLAKGACLRFLLTRCFDWLFQKKDALVVPKNPMEYVAKLRFHQKNKSFLSYKLS